MIYLVTAWLSEWGLSLKYTYENHRLVLYRGQPGAARMIVVG
jgi:hypothetical protein